MGRTVADGVNVLLRDPASGATVLFSGGDEPPDWAQAQVTNPAVWAPEPEVGDQPAAEGPPPKAGRGSSDEAWAAYAASQDVEVPEGAKRSEIIAALAAAGVPTER